MKIERKKQKDKYLSTTTYIFDGKVILIIPLLHPVVYDHNFLSKFRILAGGNNPNCILSPYFFLAPSNHHSIQKLSELCYKIFVVF